MNTTFDRVADDLPSMRSKTIHSVGGGVAQFEWNDLGGHPYTGVFSGDSKTNILRLSIAREIDKGNYKVGGGFKFLRNGVKSCNFVAMWSLSGQNSADFFANEWTNHVQLGASQSTMATAQKLLLEKFKTASAHPQYLGLSDCATYGSNGSKVASPVFPFQLFLVPAAAVKGKQNPAGKSWGPDPFQLKQFPAGTPLWDIYAIANPNAPRVKIAELISSSGFTDSKFGDKELFIQHQRMEDDLKMRPCVFPSRWPFWIEWLTVLFVVL